MENHVHRAGRPFSSTGTRAFSSALLLSGLALLLLLGVSLTVIFRLVQTQPSNEKWSFQTGSGTIHAVSLAIANGLIYSSSNRYFYALDASGRQQWSFDMVGIIASSPAVANGMVYVGANDAFGHLYALDASSGSSKWSFQTEGLIESMPIVADNVVYVSSSDAKLYAIPIP